MQGSSCRRKTNARDDVLFPDARNAAREKRNYFPERMLGVRTRARIFGGPGGGDSEEKKGGREGGKSSKRMRKSRDSAGRAELFS